MNFYYLGQLSMANRGCEALIRSNTKLLRQKYPGATFLCPTENEALDRHQWTDAAESGVSFVHQPPFPVSLKVWGRAFRALPPVRQLGVVPFSLDDATRRLLTDVDSVLMTGGDIVSLDYGLNPLYYWTGLVDAAHRLGKETHLLAASVGPFSRDPVTERHMVAHLKRYTSITVRETPTLEYLTKLGVADVRLVADPAFVLDAEPFDITGFMATDREYVGFNVSPLVRKFRTDEQSRQSFDDGIKAFIKKIVAQTNFNVLLIPHVDPLAGEWENSDRAYMGRLLAEIGDTQGRVTMTPDLLNATQIKYVLGRCRYFIGARTHATIGAISQGVPTLSIAYSVKAVGINKDLFGDTRYVLPTPEVDEGSLWKGLSLLRDEEGEIRALLREKLPVWKGRAAEGVAAI